MCAYDQPAQPAEVRPAAARRTDFAPACGQPRCHRERGTVLAAIPEAPGTCRSILRAALIARGLAALAADAETVVTELASNAVRAMRAEAEAGRLGGGLPVIVLVPGWCPRGVRIEVWDQAPGVPRMGEPDWDAEHGRGLFLVHQVTGGRWGYLSVGAAKCVWAELEQHNGR